MMRTGRFISVARSAPSGSRYLRTKHDIVTPEPHEPLGPPQDLEIKLSQNKHLGPIQISWLPPKGVRDECKYNVQSEFFNARHMGKPFPVQPQFVVQPHGVDGRHRYIVNHPHDGLDIDPRPAFTMVVVVTAELGGAVGEKTRKAITQDSVPKSSEQDLKENAQLITGPIEDFGKKHGSTLRVAVVGPQHHGKSSVVNHLVRCLRNQVNIADEVETASAGPAETTVDVKTITQAFHGYNIAFRDFPAIPNFAAGNKKAFDALLMGWAPEGTRRAEFIQPSFAAERPPHVAIIVISLTQWRDQTAEMQAYLSGMQDSLKNASKGRVAFPYVVAATHRDRFLAECQDADPDEALEKAREGIRSSANTDNVYTLTNYQETSPCFSEVNEETFRLLRQMVILAKNGNTAVLQCDLIHCFTNKCHRFGKWLEKVVHS